LYLDYLKPFGFIKTITKQSHYDVINNEIITYNLVSMLLQAYNAGMLNAEHLYVDLD